jgi:negative regulator of replication initiation
MKRSTKHCVDGSTQHYVDSSTQHYAESCNNIMLRVLHNIINAESSTVTPHYIKSLTQQLLSIQFIISVLKV